MRTSEVRWETLIYLDTFSLLAVTHLDTWHASSCTRAIIWSLLDLGVTSDSPLAKLLMHDTTQCIVNLERDLFWIGELGCLRIHLPCGLAGRLNDLHHLFHRVCSSKLSPTSSSGQLGNVYLPSSSAMSLFRRSLITWSPGFTSGDFIFNPVTAGSGVLEIGARQLNNWRLHEPPDFLPFCQPGVPSTRLYNSLMPRHHFRLPGRYSIKFLNFLYYSTNQLNCQFQQAL